MPPLYYNPDTGGLGGSGFMGDYDSATADFQNFYYSFVETSSVTYADGRTNSAQSDIHLVSVPVTTSTAPATPTLNHADPVASDGTTTLYLSNNTLSSVGLYAEVSTATTGWVQVGHISAGSGTTTMALSGLDPSKTYYYRLREQNDSTGASSGYSGVIRAWAPADGSVNLAGAVYSYYQTTTSSGVSTYWYRYHLSWNDGVDPNGTASFEYSADGSTWTLATATPSNPSSTVPQTAPAYSGVGDVYVGFPNDAGQPLYFRIRADNGTPYVGAGGYSPWFASAGQAVSMQSGDVPANPTVTSANLGWAYWDGSEYYTPFTGGPDDEMEVEIFDAYSNQVVSLSTYAAYGDAEISGLDSGNEYYVRIRASRTEVEGSTSNTYYSDWSSDYYFAT